MRGRRNCDTRADVQQIDGIRLPNPYRLDSTP